MFCMEFILQEILKYKLNNLHVLLFSNVVCFYFACYSYILVGVVRLSQYYASVVLGIPQIRRGKDRAIFEISRGVEEFSGSRGMRIYAGLVNFQDPGGWPMSDNDIFQGVQNPEDTMSLILVILKFSVP